MKRFQNWYQKRSSGSFGKLDGLTIFFCGAKVVCLSQNIASIVFRCLKGVIFLATLLVRGGVGNGKG